MTIRSRLIISTLIGIGPIASMAACGGDDTSLGVEDDAATDDVAIDTSSVVEDAALEAASRDASRADARADAGIVDAAKTLNSCGGYDVLELGGQVATPGDSCGACNDGTIACIGSDTVTCAGATSPPCPTPPVDAGPNACGGYGPLTFLSADASIEDPCGECGYILCASSTSLVCAEWGGSCATDAGLHSTCTIPSSAYAATPPSPTLPAETRPSVTSASSIALSANDLAYNPYDGFLYASIAPGPSQGNSIAKIDPMSAAVLQTIYVGPSPTQIALSDDGNALWVVVNGSTIRRVDLTTFTAGASFALAYGGPVYALEVLAGTEDSVVVHTYQFIVVYDNGIPRPYGVLPYSSTQRIATPSASLLFESTNYPASVNTICVDGNGTFLQGPAESTSYSYYSGAPVFYQGVLYNPDGNSYDADSTTLLHTFNVGTINSWVAVDTNDVYYLTLSSHSSGGNLVQVTGFDRTTYASTITDVLATNTTSVEAFTRWGRYGFAYLNGSTSIEIARSTIIPDMP